MYRKRAGTSGCRGQLYESKLICLLYFRASLDKTIEEFQLASNIDNIGAFDDICFKAKVKGHDKPVAVFIQAKHRENDKRPLTYDLTVYFDSYLKIRKTFKTSNKDEFFRGIFEDTDCLFVIYTNAADNLNGDSIECSFSYHLHELIGTSGTVKQPHRHVHDVELLRKIVIKDQVTTLAERIAEFISRSDTKSVNHLQNILQDELIKCYHVILAQTVFDVSEIVPLQVESKLCKGRVIKNEFPPHRIATFRHDFFGIKDEYHTQFKDTLFKEILKERKINSTDVNTLLAEFLADPTDVTKLSKVVGTIITYKNGQLEYLKEKASTKDFRPQLNQVQVPPSTVNEAVELAARELLLSREFNVPVSFGNKDLTIRNGKIESRINYLASAIKDLLGKSDSSNLVTIDDSLEKGFLQVNGGIAGAIGNIFVLDDNTKLMKITNKQETLGDLAKKLYERLSNEIPNLLEYKFCFKVNEFPKLSLECSEYEENLAIDFLNKLIIYSNQADEKGVEEKLKSEVEEYQYDQPNYFQVHTDAIFSKYHYDIQKWWMQPDKASYLTQESDLFQKAKKNIIKDPLLSVINAMYRNNIKHIDNTFTEDAVSSLNLQDHLNTVIITENNVLTVVKVMQHLKNKDYFVLDLKYIVQLPPNDRMLLRKELKNSNNDKVIILVCDNIQQNKKTFLENIVETVLKKKTIIITNHASVEIFLKYFPDPPVYDEKNSLINLSEESQEIILNSARVMFQDEEVRLADIIDDKSKKYVKGDVLHKIFSEEIIAVGKLIVNRSYDEIKHLYVDRCLKKTDMKQTDFCMETLNNFLKISDDIVLVTAEPGMGKSTLLTRLSIKTKEFKPEVWIVRINLLEYSEEFNKWKKEKTIIGILETLKFICQVLLRENLGKEKKVGITLEEKDNIVCLKNCTADPLIVFELNLFLHFYYNREMIFLFDGFDEICPNYADVVVKCLKTFINDPRKHRMWITSRSYSEIKTILEKELKLKLSYEIDYMSGIKYLKKFWESNLKLEELNDAQLENVKNVLEHISLVYERTAIMNVVIQNAALYLSYKIKNTHIALWKYNKNYHRDIFLKSHICFEYACDCCSCCYCMRTCSKCVGRHFPKEPLLRECNPLILYLAAVNVEHNIKNNYNNFEEWYLYVDLYKVYENFLENKIKRRYQEKNGINIYMPDVITAYEEELAKSIVKHKKLGFYTIVKDVHSYVDMMFSEEDIKEITKQMESGEEKNGIIVGVANGIPIFIHKTFAEYFAAEYICDCLKTENVCEETISFYFDMMFCYNYYLDHVRMICYKKINTDKTLMSALENNKDAIFKWIKKNLADLSDWKFMIPGTNILNSLEPLLSKTIDYVKKHTSITDSENDMLTRLIFERDKCLARKRIAD